MIGNVPQVRVPSYRPLPLYAHPHSSPCPSSAPPSYCFSSFFSPSLFSTSFFFDTYLWICRCTVQSFQSIPNYLVSLILLSSTLFFSILPYLTLLQGLPTTVTACLFIVAERMGRHNVFVKKLDIIETLGSCTLICTGKHIMIKHIILYQSGHTFLSTHDQLIGSSITSSSASVLWILSILLASLNLRLFFWPVGLILHR